MKGKKIFTSKEAEQIRILINQKVKANKNEQKIIRDKIRTIGFFFSDFSNKKKGYTVEDFDILVRTKAVEITESTKEISTPSNIPINPQINSLNMKKIGIAYLEDKLILKGVYHRAQEVDSLIPKDKTGFYTIRLIEGKSLPKKYQSFLDARAHKIIYIGKAEDQYLYDRICQEIRGVGHGTFFRSIGAVLGFLPPQGSLIGKKNQNNYKFSKEDTREIIAWINSNLEISWISYDGDFTIEKELINKYCPLLNDRHNPQSLKELKQDKNRCRLSARSINIINS